MTKNYTRIGDWYHYIRRVPSKVAIYDTRKHVRIALDTRDEKEALRRAAIFDGFIDKYWKDLILSGKGDRGMAKFNKVRALAKAHGFAYRSIAEVVDSPLEEIVSRAEAVADNIDAKYPLLGGADSPKVRLEDCPERFWSLCADRLVSKKEHEIRKYKNPRNAAMKEFIGVVGNLDLCAVSRTHILKFRNWLMRKIEKGKLVGNTANKKMSGLKDMLHTVAMDSEIELDIKMLFAGTWFEDGTQSRPPFEARHVQDKFLDGQSLGKLNWDGRMLVYMMIETGARESEIIGLDEKQDILLNTPVPHIWIRKNNFRGLKVGSTERKIPLVGVSLMAARQMVETGGIARYRGNPSSASGTINKYLLNNGLRPTEAHSLYSLRHTFKDRLRDADAPQEIIDELMGHKKHGPVYGRGRKLEQKHEWLQKIAFRPPKAI